MTCLLVEDFFSIQNRGIVFTGVVDGKFLVGDSEVFIVTKDEVKKEQIAGIEKYRKLVDECDCGDYVGLLFRIHDIEKFNSYKGYHGDLNPGYQIMVTNDLSSVEDFHKRFNDFLDSDEKVFNKIYSITIEVVEKYKDVLVKKYNQLTYVDEYDELFLDDFEKEIERFCKKKLSHLNCFIDLAKEITKNHIIYIKDRIKEDSSFLECESPFDYEKLIGERLETLGWKVRVTPKTGDQGADVISEKNGIVLVVQCKKYSGPVGNKAIQEIYSAKSFFDADYAAVVTPSSFTKSAKQLADSLDVFLLHHNELENLDNEIFK